MTQAHAEVRLFDDLEKKKTILLKRTKKRSR
jgi:hypothetical protein